MKRYIISSESTDRIQFAKELESELIERLLGIGLTQSTMDQLVVSVQPSGSGFRATVQLPTRVFHGKKISEFFYRREADGVIDDIVDSRVIRELSESQGELLKPARKPSSTAEAISEARNSNNSARLAELSRHNAASVRRLVAKNPYTDSATLKRLANDPDVNEFTINYYNMNYQDLLDLAMEGNEHAGRFVARSKEVDRDTLLSLFDYFLTHTNGRYLDPELFCSIIRRPDVLDEADYNYMLSLDNSYIDWWMSLSSNLPVSVYYQIIERYSDDPEHTHYVREANKRLNGQSL